MNMRKQSSSLPRPNKGSSRIVVHPRRLSRLPITIPVPQEAVDLETPELKRVREKLKGTTALGREILRKIAARARRAIYGSEEPVCSPAEVAGAAPTNSKAPTSGQQAPVSQHHSEVRVKHKAKLSSKPPEVGPDPSSRPSETTPIQPPVADPQPPVSVQARPAPTLPAAQPRTELDGSPTPAQGATPSQPTLHLTGASAPSTFPVRGYSMAEARRLGLA
jgi:hypothetical protein